MSSKSKAFFGECIDMFENQQYNEEFKVSQKVFWKSFGG